MEFFSHKEKLVYFYGVKSLNFFKTQLLKMFRVVLNFPAAGGKCNEAKGHGSNTCYPTDGSRRIKNSNVVWEA